MAQQTPTPEAPRLSASGSPSGELRSAATRPCPTCSSPVSINASVCPTCGDTLPSRNKQIRCRRCSGKASAALVVCPHCGRELHPAPPRLLTWGAPLLLVALFGAVLLAQFSGGSNPFSWTQRQFQRATTFVGDIGEQLQLDLSITTQPLEEDTVELVSLPVQPQAVANADMAAGVSVAGEEIGDGAGIDAETMPQPAEEPVSPPAEGLAEAPAEIPSEIPTETPTEMPVDTPTSAPTPTQSLPTATSTATPTAAPTERLDATAPVVTPTVSTGNNITPTARATAANTVPMTATAAVTAAVTEMVAETVTAATRTPTAQIALTLPTPTPPLPTATPRIHRIRAGDTLFELALANDIALDALLAANGLSENDVYTIQPGDEIIIPDPNAPIETPAPPTPTPAPTRGSFTHTVQAGDTLMAIGLRYGVNVQSILDANNMTMAQARSLRPGQELIIPGDTPAATATTLPTATPPPATATSTSTPRPTTAAVMPTSTPAAQTSAIRLDAPTLRSPENRVSVKCGAGEQLTWNAVPFIQPADIYVVHLGYVNGRGADGAEQIVWVIAQQRPYNVTLWQLDDNLCGLAPLEYGRQWRWYVDVAERTADGTVTPVSRASEIWGFTWQ